MSKEEPKQEFCDNCNNNICCCIVKKQETLEEAAREYYKRGQLGFEKAADTEIAFLRGAKWQQERSYSDEDIKNFGWLCRERSLTNVDLLFEKFKKK